MLLFSGNENENIGELHPKPDQWEANDLIQIE